MNAVEQRGPRDLLPVVVVGGGLSGLSAAVHLAARDIPVLLLEQKQHLGGRTYSFVDATTGETIDNGQHVLIRGYAATMRLVEIIGTTHLLTVQPSPVLALHHPQKGIRTFRLPSLPSPLHLAAGVLNSDLFSMTDRLRVLRAGMAMRRDSTRLEQELASVTVDEWLTSVGQSREAVRSFWEPLAVSIMNEHVTTASALLFVRSLKTAFLEGRSNAALVIPTVGLSDLFAKPAREFIMRRTGNVRCSTRVVKVRMANGAAAGVVLQDGSALEASAVVLAVPPMEALDLVPEEAEVRADLAPAAALKFSPIVSTHLWFRREVMNQDVVGLIGKTVQWVFNRRRLASGGGEGGHISATISAAHEIVGASQEEIVEIVMRDLRSAFGEDVPDPWHALVIREKRATFSATPEAERLRPNVATRVRNLFLAGDWTDTGYPATIEGAVMSGERCAALAAAL